MEQPNHRFLPQSLQARFLNLLTPLIASLSRRGFHPNTFTLAGLILTLVAAAAMVMGHLRVGGLIILAGGLCDSIDGNLARTAGKATRFGALFDSTIDRYSEFVMFCGILAYFLLVGDRLTSVVAFVALCGSIMVSYSRARAESLGFEAKAGLMQRAERILFIGLGALIHPLVFKLVIWGVAIFANLTAIQRLWHAHLQNKPNNNQK